MASLKLILGMIPATSKLEQEEKDYKDAQSRKQSDDIMELTKENFHQIRDGIEEMSYGGYGRN